MLVVTKNILSQCSINWKSRVNDNLIFHRSMYVEDMTDICKFSKHDEVPTQTSRIIVCWTRSSYKRIWVHDGFTNRNMNLTRHNSHFCKVNELLLHYAHWGNRDLRSVPEILIILAHWNLLYKWLAANTINMVRISIQINYSVLNKMYTYFR